MKNRILSIFAAIAVTLSLSACQNSNTEQTAPQTIQLSEETTSTEIQYVTDWSIDELVQNIELNGKTYSMPFTLDDLGAEYSLGEKVSLPDDRYGYNLNYNGEYFALIVINDELEVSKSPITILTIVDNTNYRCGELYYGNSKTAVQDVYGKPSYENSLKNINSYSFKNGSGVTITYENDKLVGVTIRYYN